MVYLNLYGKADKFEGQNKDVLYYTHYIEFQTYIEFRILDKQNLYHGKIIPFSVYAKNIQDVYTILQKYSSNRYIVYNSSNTRDIMSRLDRDVNYRRTFYFDVEHSGKKPPLSDMNYYKQLLDTTKYLRNKLAEEGLKISLVKETGRGFLVGIKIKPLPVNDGSDNDKKFIHWFKMFVERYEPKRPCDNIKFSDGVFNLSRIEGSPLFKHMKYLEEPFRRVIYLDNLENNMVSVLKNIKVPKRLIVASKFAKKYDKKTVWKCPEWRLLAEHADLPEGDLHNKIITALKEIFRDNNILMELLTEALRLLGYNETPDIPDPEKYQYTPKIYDNWCLKNYEYCLKNKIKIINTYKGTNNGKSFIFLSEEQWEKDNHQFPEVKEHTIENFTSLIEYIKDFNTNTQLWEPGSLKIYKATLWRNIQRLCGDKIFFEYIDFLDIYNDIFALFYQPHSIKIQD